MQRSALDSWDRSAGVVAFDVSPQEAWQGQVESLVRARHARSRTGQSHLEPRGAESAVEDEKLKDALTTFSISDLLRFGAVPLGAQSDAGIWLGISGEVSM